MYPSKVSLCVYKYYMDESVMYRTLCSVPNLLTNVLELCPFLCVESILVLLYSCILVYQYIII